MTARILVAVSVIAGLAVTVYISVRAGADPVRFSTATLSCFAGRARAR